MVLVSLWSQAQLPVISTSNLKQKLIRVELDSVKLDTSSIIPKTVSIAYVSPDDYRIDFVNAMLYWQKKPSLDSVIITYRVFPFLLNPSVQRMNYDSVMNNFYVKPFEFNKGLTPAQRGVFDFGTLKAEGSFGRQIGFGNSQDAVLNSTLNLQLSGMLSDSIEIHAAITDNNFPIQPDGSTQ